MSSIRNLVISVFRNETRILVAQGFDDVKQEWFLRPLGGAVKFGELAVDALRREIREELGEEITDPVQLGVLENVFTYRGEPGHEIVFVFDARFVDADVYSRTRLSLNEPVWDGSARWIDLADPLPFALYPEGLTTLLNAAV